MVPFVQENMMTVACSNKEKGKSARGMCKVGCIGCGVCVKKTEQFSVEDNLARLVYEKYEPGEETEAAFNKCPTCVIIYVGKSAPPPRPAKKPASPKKSEPKKD